MVNKVNMMFNISNFESVSEGSGNKLVGGFSTSAIGNVNHAQFMEANNCDGGNCEAGCGGGSTINCVAGCGEK